MKGITLYRTLVRTLGRGVRYENACGVVSGEFKTLCPMLELTGQVHTYLGSILSHVILKFEMHRRSPSPLMHEAQSCRLENTTPQIVTSPASLSPALGLYILLSITTLLRPATNAVRPAYMTEILPGPSSPPSSSPGFRLNYAPRRGALGADLYHQTDGSLMRGDGGRATLEADSSTHLGEAGGIHPERSRTLPHPTARQVDSVANTCRAVCRDAQRDWMGGEPAETTRCFPSSSKPAEWR